MNIHALINDTYRIESEIGSGGGGTVYKAWHTRLQKYVVIKEQIHGINDSGDIRRNEVEALKNVKNPFLPHVHDFITEGSSAYTVMEYIEGESFDCLLQDGRRFSRDDTVRWYRQLTSALEELHSKNICHRDIKPANIMLTTGGDVCLIDFNSAYVAGNTARLLSRSPGYASPEQYELYERVKSGRDEQVKGKYTGHSESAPDDAINKPLDDAGALCADYSSRTELSGGDRLSFAFPHEDVRTQVPIADADQMVNRVDWVRSDIYSLGATMYHILTGKRPQERGRGDATPLKYRRCDAGIARIIEQSTYPEPSERFASAAELSAAIRRVKKRGKAYCMNRAPGKAFLFCGIITVLNAAMILAATKMRKNPC